MIYNRQFTIKAHAKLVNGCSLAKLGFVKEQASTTFYYRLSQKGGSMEPLEPPLDPPLYIHSCILYTYTQLHYYYYDFYSTYPAARYV